MKQQPTVNIAIGCMLTKIHGVESQPVTTMNATLSFLEQLKASNDGASDYRAAKMLGITQQTISKWRARGSQMSDETALKVASLLGLPPIQVIAKIHMEQAKDPGVRTVWKELSNGLEIAH